MKILLYDETPAYFTPGGKQVLAMKLRDSLRVLGVDAEYARWWDPSQHCDMLQLFACAPNMVYSAHRAGAKVVLTHVVDYLSCLRPWQLTVRSLGVGTLRRLLPPRVFHHFPWHILPQLDSLVYIHRFDAQAAIQVYAAPREKIHIIPHGCDRDQIAELARGPQNHRSYLISVGNIVPRKNSLLLAKAAREANVPVVFLGKPLDENGAYYAEFYGFVDGKRVIYEGYVSERKKHQWLIGASGFVLLSEAESGCVAVYEAAAARLPLLLADRPWAHVYGSTPGIRHVALGNVASIAGHLRAFYDESCRLEQHTFPVVTWEDVARQYLQVYQSVLVATT